MASKKKLPAFLAKKKAAAKPAAKGKVKKGKVPAAFAANRFKKGGGRAGAY